MLKATLTDATPSATQAHDGAVDPRIQLQVPSDAYLAGGRLVVTVLDQGASTPRELPGMTFESVPVNQIAQHLGKGAIGVKLVGAKEAGNVPFALFTSTDIVE